MKADNKFDYKVYWEKQGVDSLCGVHCINSLLQGKPPPHSGPFYDEVKLSEIALNLDKQEEELMRSQGMTSDYAKYLRQESGNVALDGNYSIQVLQEALKRLNLQMISIDTADKKADLTTKTGFICNSSAHWIAIRKIKGIWYNLNSLGMRLPEIISDFYLSAFLAAVKQCGYQIFSVEGEYPTTDEDSFDHYNPHQEWYPSKRIHKYNEKKIKRPGYKPNISGGGNDKQMEKAIALSLGKEYKGYVSSGEDSDWQNDKKKEVKAFSGAGVSMGGSGSHVPYEKFNYDPEDADMIILVRESMEESFKNEPLDGFLVTFRFPDGRKARRNFHKDSHVEQLYDYVWMNKNPHERFSLVNQESRQTLDVLELPITFIVDESDGTILVNVVDS